MPLSIRHIVISPYHARTTNGALLVRREIPSKLVLARRAREVKQNARKKVEADAIKAAAQIRAGVFGMSKHAITWREKWEARRSAAASSGAEAQAIIMEDCDGDIVDEGLDFHARKRPWLRSRPSI
jgi:hypothetical protein